MTQTRCWCRHPTVVAASLCLISAATARGADASKSSMAPDGARVNHLAAMLPTSPCGVGRPVVDRKAWDVLAKTPAFARVIRDAEKLLPLPIPELTDELFLDFSQTGNRSRCQRVLSQRHGRVPTLVVAECLENEGRFLPALEEAIRAVCSEKTWVMPAHDRRLHNFRQEVNEIDLAVAGLSWNLTTAHYWLGQRLSAPVRELIVSELERRTFRPFEGMITKGEPRMWWLTGTNNWNAVCLAGVTGSALAMIESPERRAFFVAAAEKSVQYFLKGFTSDGYCSEGIGYWNYGFGHFIMLAETVRQATGGQIDMMDDPKVEQIARFGRRIEILPGLYPAFADCSVGSEPGIRWMAYVSRRFGMGLTDVERQGLLLTPGPSSSLFELGLMTFANSASERPATKPGESVAQLRDWFDEAGILICRPAADDSCRMGVALKGGHNAEHHNHNDVGSFVVAVGGGLPLLDPGGEVYTARTFSSKRYESAVLNSLGHPVPRVAGQLQRSGRSAAAKVVQFEITDKSDKLVLDLRAAYGVKALKQLTRTFEFSRAGQGSLTVIDTVEFTSPQEFGTALVTFSDWKQPSPNQLIVGSKSESVRIEIAVDGSAFQVNGEQIEEDVRHKRFPTRLGINLAEPVTRATVAMTITPVSERRR